MTLETKKKTYTGYDKFGLCLILCLPRKPMKVSCFSKFILCHISYLQTVFFLRNCDRNY